MSDTSAIEHDSTSLVTVLSSDHGRQRRAERRIGKRDLQAAVKYGVRGMGFPCPRTGAIRYKFTYADVVYITDETCRQEITSWPAPGAGFDMALKEITPAAAAAHARARATLHASPGSWTSHTVIVVDQSGSMRRPDVADGATRSDAVWVTLAHAFVKEQLESGTARDTDVVSLVAMNDGGTLLLDREPLDWLLYNRLVELLRSAEPKSRGNYLPALDQAEECLLHNTHGSCALLLMFLSDGRPSDCPPRGPGHSVIKLRAAVRARLSGLASRFGRRLTVGMIGFGPPGEDFSLLSSMAECCTPYGSSGVFQRPDMSIDALRSVFTSLSSTLTATKVELTKLGGSAQRTVRDVRREPVGADYMLLGSDLSLDLEDWFYYDSATDIESRVRWSPAARTWEELLTFISEGAVGVAMHQSIFGEGAERMVRQFREVDVSGWFVGQPLVAKESRFLEDLDNDDLRHFHRTFCETQFRAQELAQAFNRRLERIPGVDASTPRISFLECSVYVVQDSKRGWIGVLVEKMLDPGRYKKWNNNAGHVHGMAALQWQQPPAAGATASQEPALAPGNNLGVIEEGDEEEECDSSDEDNTGLHSDQMPASAILIQPADIPQAFSHFTYRHTQRKMLVCDLQGVYNEACSPPLFELTDPVIHFKSSSGRSNVFGRTDQGHKGIQSFFKTHKCSALCHALNKTWLPDERPVAALAQRMSEAWL